MASNTKTYSWKNALWRDKWAPKINSPIPPIDIHTPALCQFIFGNSKITRTPCISDLIFNKISQAFPDWKVITLSHDNMCSYGKFQ